MEKENTKNHNGVKIGNIPFKEVVDGFLKVKPPKKEKSKKNKKIDKKD